MPPSYIIEVISERYDNMSKEEKEKMVRDAEQFADQDKKKREEAEIRNNADNLVYTAEKTKKDIGDKISQDQKDRIDVAVSALKDALASNDLERMKTRSEELTKVLQEVGTAVYQQASADYAKQKGQPGPETPPPSGEKVVDSEDYKVK
jgi:molecular chaperone DnaK